MKLQPYKCAILLSVVVSARCLAAGVDDTITLTPGSYHQQITGFGGAILQGSAQALANADATYSSFQRRFDSTGLNLSFIRVGNYYGMPDSTDHAFSYSKELEGTIYAIQNFRKYKPSGMVLMTAFSPPASIRTTGSTLGSGTHVNTITSNAQYAAWWLESMQYYQSQGALPDAITLQNEPDITSSAYENCWFSPAGYGAALDATRKLFAQQTDAELHDMRFFGPEVCETNDLASYMIEPTSADVEAITHHFYGDLSDATLGKIESDYNWWKWNKYETENSATGFVPAAGEPKYMGLAVDIYKCLAIEEANAYLIWDLAWQIDSVHYTPITYTYEANMLGQYAKFVQPGDWHIYESNSDADVLCTAYKHNLNNGDKERMVMVIVNTAAAAKTVRLDLSAFWASKAAHCLYNVYQTSPTANLVHTTAYSGAAAKKLGNPLVSLPGYSVTTVIQN